MSLIKSVAGIRGTIGGQPGINLTPLDVVKFSGAFATLLQRKYPGLVKVVVGRDARISGEMISRLVISSLEASGCLVVDIGLATTPTVEMAVVRSEAQGGIIITASHNPIEWNALKLLNHKGEFLSPADGELLQEIVSSERYSFSPIQELGKTVRIDDALDYHISHILQLPLVDREAIKKKNFKVVIDSVNSVGGLAIPALLRALGLKDIVELNGDLSGNFSHNPEPLNENLTELCQAVKDNKADLGIAVDPDVDRLAFIREDGIPFGEEYTLVAVADYVLANFQAGRYQKTTVSNLSSSRALKDIAERQEAGYQAAAVGEWSVVTKMKELGAVIGGEGNGGVIYPELHNGRDALVGTALFLSYLAKRNISASKLREEYPNYCMAKKKINLPSNLNISIIFSWVQERYGSQGDLDLTDGLKINFPSSWVQLRSSNTEPILRIYSEAKTQKEADDLATELILALSSHFSL